MRIITASLVFIFFNSHVSGQALQNKIDSVSYALGAMIVKNMQQQGIKEVNTDLVAKAIEDALQGKEVLLYADEAQLCLNNYVNELRNAKEGENIEKGKMFLAENAKRPEVTVLPSGLQYEVLVEGSGPSPTATDKVKAHYHGTLIDGTVFDSSVEKNQPITYNVNGFIKGWQEALQKMNVGGKWKLYIPYDLAYGKRGSGPVVGPYATLIFEIELLGIEQ
jgi:FKBP-type peptidyl-prolyl cis-trans isomerase FklB